MNVAISFFDARTVTGSVKSSRETTRSINAEDGHRVECLVASVALMSPLKTRLDLMRPPGSQLILFGYVLTAVREPAG